MFWKHSSLTDYIFLYHYMRKKVMISIIFDVIKKKFDVKNKVENQLQEDFPAKNKIGLQAFRGTVYSHLKLR